MPTPIPAQLKPLFKEAKELLTQQQNYNEARRVLTSIPLAEQFTQFHTAMSRISTLEGDDDLAYAHIERALALTPNDVLILARLGKMCLAKNEKDKALSFAQRAYELVPTSKKEISILATLFNQLNQPQTTHALLEIGIDKNPNDPKLRRMMALCLLKLDNPKAAETELDACLRIAPTNHAAIVMLAEIYLKQGLSSQAIKLLRTADNESCPDKLRARIIINTAESHFTLGILQDAKAELTRVDNTSGARYNFVWGKIQLEEGNYDLCLKSLQASLDSLLNGDTAAIETLVSKCMHSQDKAASCRNLIAETATMLSNSRGTSGQRDANQARMNDMDDFDLV